MQFKSLFLILTIIIVSINISLCFEDGSSEIIKKFTWSCANNASCLDGIAKNVVTRYQRNEPIDFGLFSLEPIPKREITGRSSKVMDFLNGNSIRIPIGPMVFSVERSKDDGDYLELSLLRKISEQGRGHNNKLGNKRLGKKEKKHLQIMIPMFLAANAIGWTLLAVKAVGVLSAKALLVSKLALLAAVGIIVKKIMDSSQEKMTYPHFQEHHEQTPYMMSYNMEFPMHAQHALHGAELGANEIYSYHMGSPHDISQAAALGSLGAESTLSHAVEMQNGTQSHMLAALSSPMAQKVNREDGHWGGMRRKPAAFNYLTPSNPAHIYRKINS